MLAEIQSYIGAFLNEASAILWGVPMLVLLIGTHIFMTFRTKGVQRKIFKAISLTVKSDKESGGDISHFGALAVSMAATVGTGNIIGVGTAITLGGPGAVFWCWMTGVFGIATKYAESLIAVKYREKTSDGTMIGGAMVVLDKVLNMRFLSVFFCIATIAAAFGIGNMTQANSVASLLNENLSVPPYITGIVMAILVGVIIIGGVKSLSKVCTYLVPFMAVFYVIGCIVLLFINYNYVFDAIELILKSAFDTSAVLGGTMGGGMMLAMRYGFARGLFSNESGMGSAPIVSAAAKTNNAVRQALIASSATFWDTVIICALTGVVLVSSVLAYPDINFTDGAVLTSMAFGKMHWLGSIILTIALLTFVFSTILGWSYYSEKTLEYLAGKKAIPYYRIIWVICIFIGSVAQLDLVWAFSDCANALMAIPNLVAVLALSGVVARETQKYLWNNRLDDIDKDLEV